MAKFIAFLNPKGGCGKTTLSINVAQGLRLRDYQVIFGDCDPQGSARNWRAVAGDGDYAPVYGIDRPKLVPGITQIAAEKDFVIIDGPANDMEIDSEAIIIADLIVIPVNPSPFDVWACGELVKTIKTRQKITNGEPKSFFVFTRQKGNTNLSKEVRKALEKQEMNMFSSFMSDREEYKQSVAKGRTIYESGNAGGIKDIEGIVDEILAAFK